MSAKVHPRPKLWLFVLQTVRVRPYCKAVRRQSVPLISLDANNFKEAFIKAQQENEALFSKAS